MLYFLMWNLIGSIIILVIFTVHKADLEERKREELEKRRKAKFEEKYLREKKELQELLLGLSINESQVIRELMRNTEPHRLVYDNYMLGIYMFEIYDYNTRETFYVIYDWNYSCYYHSWKAYTGNEEDIIKIVEYHRNLRKEEP